MQRAKNRFQVDRVFAAILVIAVLSIGLFALVSLVERLALPWQFAALARQSEAAPSPRPSAASSRCQWSVVSGQWSV